MKFAKPSRCTLLKTPTKNISSVDAPTEDPESDTEEHPFENLVRRRRDNSVKREPGVWMGLISLALE